MFLRMREIVPICPQVCRSISVDHLSRASLTSTQLRFSYAQDSGQNENVVHAY
jgi:hypothetical protein